MKQHLLPGLLFGLAVCGCQGSTAGNQDAVVKRGEYLVAFGQCNDCHTPKILHADGTYDLDGRRLLSGHPAAASGSNARRAAPAKQAAWAGQFSADQTAWSGPWGVSFTANLTPDDATGLGKWTLADFISTIRHGVHEGEALYPPMPWCDIRHLSHDDLAAIYAYFRTLRPIRNEVPSNIPGPSGPPRAVCPKVR